MSSAVTNIVALRSRTLVRIFFAAVALQVPTFDALAMPVLDNAFGTGGVVRIGVPDALNETPTASALQPDGKVLAGGQTGGRDPQNFVVRFNRDGSLDATFGNGGVALFSTPGQRYLYEVEQLEQRPDGSMLVGMRATEGTLFVRLTPAGAFDASFGIDGVAAFSTFGSYLDGRFVQQPDGGILIVSQVSLTGAFALRLVRLTATGALDNTYAPSGEKILGNLPAGFSLEDAASVRRRITVVAEPDGGFAALARAYATGGTYLLLRVTPSGLLNPAFGSDGLVSGYDVGYPFDQPTRMVRTVDNGLLLLGDVPERNGTQSGIDRVALWRVTPAGFLDLSFGTGGHVAAGNPDAASMSGTFSIAALGDRGVAVVDSTSYSVGAALRVLRFDQAGSADVRFGAAGSASLKLADYAKFIALGVMPDDAGGLLVPGLAASTYTCYQSEPPSCIPGRSDVAVAHLDATGRPQVNYGGADGVAIWRTPTFSIESIDAMLVDSLGKIVTVGLETSPVFSHVVTRLQPGGAVDGSFGVNGRLSLGDYQGCQGNAIRAVAAPAESVIVAQGIANGSRCEFEGTVLFRFDATGKLDAGYKPGLTVPFTYASQIALGVAADGGLLYGTGTGTASSSNPPADRLSVVLQKTLPDGLPDLQFGINGQVTFPLESAEYPGQTDLQVLADGSIVFAVITRKRLRVFKVDAHGLPVASFGTQGQFAYAPVVNYIPALGGEFSLLALADGSLLATINVADFGPPLPPESLLAMRISANGVLLGASTIVAGSGFMNWRLVALPDASVVIARTRRDAVTSTAALFRLLPDNTLDGNFGVAGAYELAGMLSVSALALDANGRLLVAGQDAAGAMLARYDLGGGLASTPVVEYYNTALRHYFITASPGEMASIEAGGAGAGWQRTGYGFRAYLPETSIAIGARPVCRFYGTPGRGPNSHFYTASAAECATVQQDPGWALEGIALYLFPPVAGQCGTGQQAVYRVYNNRFAQNDSNHRYTTDPAVYAQMQTQGWLPEGVVFCGPAH